MPIAWNMFYPNASMPTNEPILITWKGEIMLSLERIQMTSHEVWRKMRDVLISEVGSEGHVGGFSWNGDEGYVGSSGKEDKLLTIFNTTVLSPRILATLSNALGH
jgi:hypothetical protein